ncbi:MAG TPA: D-glucuronyl C5-epimerase family protein [Gaiellaceae bacterium]|nr:D-glucuronyl C5-epimerase family protein [Gaiellaceae bacterium]
MKRLGLLVTLCYLAAASPASAGIPQIDVAKRGLAAAVEAGRVAPADAARYRGILARTAHALPRLGGSRAANLRSVLDDVANKAEMLTAPRALTLFSELDVNTRWFGAKGPPAYHHDVLGPDLILYRYFPGHGLQFHPLGNFGQLNSLLATGKLDDAREQIDALEARAIGRDDGSAVWEYEFRYMGARAPWTSGMAQAVAAQSLARASQKLNDPTLLELARRAEKAIPGKLTRQLPAGPWVRLYSFSQAAVLNAQLQTAVAIRDYATIAGDGAASALADAMTKAAQTMLPQFDTGYWTLYQLGGGEETRSYHDYVISMLGRLKAQTQDPFWADAQARFKSYDTEPPLFAAGPPAAAAAPAKKGSAKLKLTFWLSKSSSVVVRVGSRSRTLSLGHGWHGLAWTLPRSQPGVFPVSLQARPVAGPSAKTALLPLVVLGKSAPARATASARDGSSLVVGVAENAVVNADPAASATQFGLATALGMHAVRIAVPWNPGQTAPDPAQLPALTTAAQQAALLGVRLYLEVYPASAAVAPLDDATRGQFVEYLRQLALALPQVKDVVVGSQVNSAAFWPQGRSAAATYLALLAPAYDALKAVDPSIQVIGASLASQGTPGSWLLSLGQAYRKSGRAAPVMDALAIQPENDAAAQAPSFVHPHGPIDIGDYPRLVANLKRAFDGTAQPGATLPIVYDGYGVDSQIPPGKASLYTGTETDAVDETTQGAFYAQALQLAACQPTVSALLFQHTVDEGDLSGRQSGLYYRDATPKSDVPAVQSAIASVGSAPCPATPSAPSAPTGSPANPQLSIDGATANLACDATCYYVAVLEDADGVPLRAKQGTVAAGAPLAATVPTAGLPAGAYTLSAWLVPRAGPQQGTSQVGQSFTLP